VLCQTKQINGYKYLQKKEAESLEKHIRHKATTDDILIYDKKNNVHH
jgi:hypothetical protein